MMTALYLVGKRNNSHIVFILAFNMRSGESNLLVCLLSLGVFSRTWSRVFRHRDFLLCSQTIGSQRAG